MVSYSMMEGAEHGLGNVVGHRTITAEDRRLVTMMQEEMGAGILSTEE